MMTSDEFRQPTHLPVRMLNEYVYCPRLFHIEWAEARWAENDDTTAGSLSHTWVDHRGGRMPDPDDDQPPVMTTAVRISNDELGLTAIIDRVDHADGTCTPVDYKVGRPAPGGGPWPADRIQVLAQAALLHLAGYRVTRADLYYRATHERVTIEWNPSRLQEVRTVASEARRVAEKLEPPLPLIDSPKCPRCSLVGICLPDEINSLTRLSPAKPRRLVPARPDDAPLYVTEQGSTVGVKGDLIQIRSREHETLGAFRLCDVSSLCVFGHVQITTETLNKLWRKGATVLWFSYGGWLNGWSTGRPSKYSDLHVKQVAFHARGTGISRSMIEGKIRNQRTMLRRNSKIDVTQTLDSLKDLAKLASNEERLPSLLGHEGTAARLYFNDFTTMITNQTQITSQFDTNGRNRRPCLDPINALLSFGYSLLLRDAVSACLTVGLDPYLGVLHRSRYGRPSLALDLMEEFRPLVVDSVVISLLNRNQATGSSFRITPVGCSLTQATRRTFIAAYEKRINDEISHPLFGYSMNYRRMLDVQARQLASVFIGELPKYHPIVTR